MMPDKIPPKSIGFYYHYFMARLFRRMLFIHERSDSTVSWASARLVQDHPDPMKRIYRHKGNHIFLLPKLKRSNGSETK